MWTKEYIGKKMGDENIGDGEKIKGKSLILHFLWLDLYDVTNYLPSHASKHSLNLLLH